MHPFFSDDFAPYRQVFPELPEAQLKSLVLYGQFYKVEHIALKLDVSVPTVYEHLNRVKEKHHITSLFELRLMFYSRTECHLLNKIDVFLNK